MKKDEILTPPQSPGRTTDHSFQRIVCLGDSITAAGWPAILERLLTERGFPGVHCINAGVRGNTSTQGLRRLDKDVLSHSPDLALVEFGFNDCNIILNGPKPRTLPEQFRTNMESLVDRIREKGAQVILIANHRTLLHRILPDGRTYEEHSQDYSAIISQVAAEKRVPLLDMRVLFPGPGLELEEALAEDGIHLSEKGVQAYAEVVADFLVESGLCSCPD